MEGGVARGAPDKMMISRAYQRFYAIFGWQPLGVLLAILLVFALVMDNLYGEYAELDQEITGLEKKLRTMKAKIGQQKQLEAALKEKQEKLAEMQGRGFGAPNPDGAANLLIGEMQTQVAAVRGAGYLGTPQPPVIANGLAVVRADVQFTALTQQLVALLDNLPNAPQSIRVNTLEIGVADPAQPSTLTVRAVVQGFSPIALETGKQAAAVKR